MFGKNEVHKPFRAENGSLVVNSIFHTMQGEGPDAGKSAIFVRLTHCNLRCWFCDTEFSKGDTMTLEELVGQVLQLRDKHRCKLVVITGGEPLLQNIIPFTAACNVAGMIVSVETAGTLMLPNLNLWFKADRSMHGNLIVCSPKTPRLNEELLPLIGAFKYIIRYDSYDPDTGLPIGSTQHKEAAGKHRGKIFAPPRDDERPIYIQPMDEQEAVLNRRNLTQAALLALQYNHILSVQLHKLANLP